MIDPELIRREYGFLGSRIHANACSVAVPPMRVQQCLRDFYPEYLKMVYDSDHFGFGWLRTRVRGQLTRLIGGKPENFAFTKNTTEGTALLAKGYPLGPGDNVVVADLENPSNLFPWVQAAAQRGFELRLVKTDRRGITARDYLAHADAHTKIIAVSMVQAGTGTRVDLKRLGTECRRRGIVLSVDAIQGLGRLALDVEDCRIDFLTCGGFKGLAAGFGIGFLYCTDSLIPLVEPLIAGDGCTEADIVTPGVFTGEQPMDYLPTALRFEGGSSNTLGIWMLHHALALIEEAGMEDIQAHVLHLEACLRERLSGCGLDVLPPGELPSGVVVAWYPRERDEQAAAVLKKYGICISNHPGYLRLSLSLHNTEAQMDAIAAAFREIGEGL